MKTLFPSLLLAMAAPLLIHAQKGIDTQTQKIKEDANKTTTRQSDASRSFDWGKGKTHVRDRLTNPYPLASRRDVLVETIKNVIKDQKLLVDEASSRMADGMIITQPFIFAKGPVTAAGELNRYGEIAFEDRAWSRGRYTLTIEIQSVDGVRNNVMVNAKVEGRSGNGLTSEWVAVPSSGLAEDEFLAKLVEAVTGASPDDPKPVDQD
jgi:hypothetical protein